MVCTRLRPFNSHDPVEQTHKVMQHLVKIDGTAVLPAGLENSAGDTD